MTRALTAATLFLLSTQPTFAAEVARDGAPLPVDAASRLEIGPGSAFPAGLQLGEENPLWLAIDPRGFLAFEGAQAGPDPTPLAAATGPLVAAFWSDLQVGACPGEQAPRGEIRWAPTERGLRVSWLDMPSTGCPEGRAATFSAELTTDAAGHLIRVELTYEALPDSAPVEPRAGLALEGTVMELLADGRDAPVHGRAKRLLEYGSERAVDDLGERTGPIVSGVWVIELDAEGHVLEDPDFDGVRSADNCPRAEHPNPWQWNADGDLRGDVCDLDSDNDRRLDAQGDNCRLTANADQADRDGDGVGDACDDKDGDRLVDAVDRCPDAYDPAALDLDADGIPDACDGDIDGDDMIRVWPAWRIWLSHADECPYLRDPDRSNSDGDALGDACDLAPLVACKGFGCRLQADADGDRVPDALDTCPTVPDPAQLDADGDGLGDACDPDLDADGIPDIYEAVDLLCDPGVCGPR